MAKIIIIGAGQGGRLLLNMFRQFYPEDEMAGLIDDKKENLGKKIDGVEVIGASKDLEKIKKIADSFIVAIGCSNLKARAELFETAKKSGLKPVNAINPNCYIDKTAKLGKGLTIFPNTTINMDAKIGNNVTIYSGAVIEHECEIGDHVYISPGVHLAGNVSIGEMTFIGIGANVVQGIKIGKNSIIGAGAVVLEDVPENVTVAGVPAKIIRKHGKNETGCIK